MSSTTPSTVHTVIVEGQTFRPGPAVSAISLFDEQGNPISLSHILSRIGALEKKIADLES